MSMSPDAVETMYESLARAIDAVGPARSELFLAKLALALGHALGDAAQVTTLIADCAQDLDRA